VANLPPEESFSAPSSFDQGPKIVVFSLECRDWISLKITVSAVRFCPSAPNEMYGSWPGAIAGLSFCSHFSPAASNDNES
jgi:hypothetical protein